MSNIVNGMSVAPRDAKGAPFNPPEFTPNRPIIWAQAGPDEDPRSRLHASVYILGVFMHLEAWEARTIEVDGVSMTQEVKAWPEDFESVYSLCGVSAFQTLEIEGREYVLIATPGED